MEKLSVKILSDKATLPSKGSKNSVGFDIFSAQSVTIPPNEHKLIKTDIIIKFPYGTYGRLASRSGLCYHSKIIIPTGTIDPDYTGELRVLMFNLGKIPFKVEEKMRICQLICEKASFPEIEEIDILTPTQRNNKGFGSTGNF